MGDMTALHNRLAPQIVERIVRPVVEAGGSPSDIMMLTESVLVGVAIACIRIGGDNKVLDVMVDNARRRLAALRLGPIDPAGRA